MNQDTVDSMEAQLRVLYEEREFLADRFGVSSADEVAGMVESLEAQLRDFYDRFGGIDGMGDAETAVMIDQIKSLSTTLDQMYSKKTVEFSVVDDKPVLRAQWTESLENGDNQ